VQLKLQTIISIVAVNDSAKLYNWTLSCCVWYGMLPCACCVSSSSNSSG